MTEEVIGGIGYFKYENAVFFAFAYNLQICQDQCYTKFVSCAITGKERNRIKNNVEFHRQKR